MTKKVKDDAVNEASSKAVSKYLEGKKLNFVNIPLFEKLLSMKGYSGPSGNNPGEVQPKSRTSADADNTGANVEAGKKSSEAALADESRKSEPSKSVHFEKNREAGIVNPAFQSSDIVEDSVKSDAGGDLAMNFGAATDNKGGESKPGESPMHRSTNDSASKRSETDVAESKHKEDCETHAANDEVDENPGVKPKVENRSDNNAGQHNERPCKENKNVMIGEAMDSDTFISIEAAVAHAHGEEASSDESNDEGQRAGLRKSGKVSLRKACMHNQKHAPRMDGDRVRRRNSRRNIGGNRLYVGEPTLINLEGEVVIEKFQIEPETGFLNRVLADTTKGFIRDPPPSSESNLAGPSIVTGSHERNELHTNEAADAQNESQAAPEAGGRRGPRYSSEEVAFTLRSLLGDTNERKEESDNPASDGFLTGEDCQTTDGFQTADDGASECDSVGTHGDDFYDCEDATSLHEYAGLATSQSLLPAHQDVEGKGGDDYDGDDSDGSIVYDCTKTSESINVGDTLLEQTVVETAVNTKAAMQVDQIPSSAVGEQMDPGTAIGLTEDSNSRGESSRSPTMGLESLDSEQAETNRSPCDRQGGPSVSGGVQSTYTFEGDAEMEVNESILVTTGETQGDVALLSDDDGEGANGLAISDTIPRTSSPFASAANAESPANSGLMETKSSEDPKPAQAGKNEQVVGPEASAKKQVNVGNGPPGAANNVVLHELENLVQVLKNYSDPSVRHSIRQFAEERSRNRCLIQRKNLLLNAIAMSSKKTTRTFLHMLKEHMLRIKYIVHNEQGSSIPISEEVCTLVWDLPLTQFAKLETIVDDIAFIFDSPMAKIKTIPEVLYRADYELSTGMLQRQLQHELSRAGNR